jgi:hypothetical protein
MKGTRIGVGGIDYKNGLMTCEFVFALKKK